jgi:hypothetical protein
MKKDTTINKIAKRISHNLQQPQDISYGVDPITIIIIIGVILSLIRVIQECRKKRTLLKNKYERSNLLRKDIQDIILKDSWLNNLRLYHILKKHLSKQQYKVYGKQLKDSIMEVGINLTEDETYALMEAADD